MIDRGDVLSVVLARADKPGQEHAPIALLRAVREYPDPIRAPSEPASAATFFQAMRDEFPAVDFLRSTFMPPDEEFDALVALIRWLRREYRDWRAAIDPTRGKLVALFIATAFCDIESAFWASFPPGLEGNADLLATLERMIRGCNTVSTMNPDRPALVWEQEAVDRLARADAQGDWRTIGDLWPMFRQSIETNVLIEQSVRCLHRFGPEQLVGAIADVRQTAVAAQIVGALPRGQALRLGALSDNPYLQFATVNEKLSKHMPQGPLTGEERQSLTVLIRKVAGDPSRWTHWMHHFNRYPSRYPTLQAALGEALATASGAALQAYVDAIDLAPIDLKMGSDDSRQAVAACLDSFRAAATPERRTLLWTLAYRRWRQWRFGLANNDKYLFWISFSALDYAVLGYLVECMTEDQRAGTAQKILAKLMGLEHCWHASQAHYLTAWHRLLSHYQPYAHVARTKDASIAWPMPGVPSLPFNPHDDRYAALRQSMAAVRARTSASDGKGSDRLSHHRLPQRVDAVPPVIPGQPGNNPSK